MFEVIFALILVLAAGVRHKYRALRAPRVVGAKIRRYGRDRGTRIDSWKPGLPAFLALLATVGMALPLKSDGDTVTANEFNELVALASGGGQVYSVYQQSGTTYAIDPTGNTLASAIVGVDDAGVIQAAIDAVPTTGGVVDVACATYTLLETLVPKDNLVLIGLSSRDPANNKGTTFKIADGANIDAITGPATDIRVTFRDFRIDGNKDNQTATSRGIVGSFSRSLFDNLALGDVRDNAITLTKVTYAFYNHVSHCYFNDCGGVGVEMLGTDGNVVESCDFNISTDPIDGVGTYAFKSDVQNSFINNYVAKYNGGCQLNGNGSRVQDNTFDSVCKHVVQANSLRQVIQNNKFYNSGNLTNATYTGIQLTTNAVYCIVTGNKFYNNGGYVNVARYCIQETANDQHNLIANNLLAADVGGATYTTLAIKLGGTTPTSTIVNNPDAPTEYIPDGVTVHRGRTGVVTLITQSGYSIYADAAEANPTIQLANAALKLGAGGATALDVALIRAAAGVLGASTDGVALDGTFKGLILAALNAGGGADPTLAANASNQSWRSAGHFNPDADNTWNMGTNHYRWGTWNGAIAKFFAAQDDAKEAVRISVSGVHLGPGGATDTDMVLERAAADSMRVDVAFTPGRYTTAQRDAIAAPANGMMIYNTTTNKFQGRAAGAWADLN